MSGCGKMTHVTGTNGGVIPCGSNLTRFGETKPYYCAKCSTEEIGKAGEFVVRVEDGKTYIFGPKAYMEEKGNALVDAICKGKDQIFNMCYGQSPNLETAVAVRLQTDYAGWIGMSRFEHQIGWDKAGNCVQCGEAGRCTCDHSKAVTQ